MNLSISCFLSPGFFLNYWASPLKFWECSYCLWCWICCYCSCAIVLSGSSSWLFWLIAFMTKRQMMNRKSIVKESTTIILKSFWKNSRANKFSFSIKNLKWAKSWLFKKKLIIRCASLCCTLHSCKYLLICSLPILI